MAKPEAINGAIPASVRGEDAIQPYEYKDIFDGGTTSLGSWNWGLVSVACDGWRKHHGRSSFWTVEQSLEWFRGWLTKNTWPENGHGGHEWRSGIYLRYMARSVRALRGLAILHGDTVTVNLASEWLRHYAGVSALIAVRARPREQSYEQIKANRGPGLLVADGPPWNSAPPFTVADCGLRSWENTPSKGSGTLLFYRNFSDVDLGDALGVPGGKHDDVGAALWSVGSDGGFALTPAEQADMSACIDGDVAAAGRVLDMVEATGYPCGYDYHLFRYGADATVSILQRMPHGSSTAPSIAKKCERFGDTARTSVLVADGGGRDSGADDYDVGPSTATIAPDFSIVKVQRDDKYFAEVSMPLPAAAITFHAILHPSGIERLIPAPVVPPPPPPPDPPPTPKPQRKPSWIERMGL